MKWTTATEKNNAYFDVERSTNGKNFSSVGRVEGRGTTSAGAAYSLTDRSPLPVQAYYRLRQVDTDGTESYSAVVAVAASGKLEVYPNPSTGIVYLPASDAVVRYRVYSATGQVVAQGEAQGGSAVDVQHLPVGIYSLELNTASQRNMQRFLRQQ